MNKRYKSLTKLPDIDKEVVNIMPSGKTKVTTKTVKNRYLLVLEDNSSVVLTSDQLKTFGIYVEELKEPKEPAPTITQIIEDAEDEAEELETIEENNKTE